MAKSDGIKLGGPAVQRSQDAAAPEVESVSSIGAGMTIVGKITCDGVLQVFGRIEGELRASNVLIGHGAQVEGEIFAQDLAVEGGVKGVIRATRVKLHGTAEVEGDIYHRSLAMEENARFQGSSRREESIADTPTRVQEGPSLQPQQDKASVAVVAEG